MPSNLYEKYLELKELVEDAPVNNVGSGNIAGVGVGPNGEPGISKKNQNKYRKRNALLAKDIIKRMRK